MKNCESILHFYGATSWLLEMDIRNDYMYSYLKTRGITCEESPRMLISLFSKHELGKTFWGSNGR